MNIFSDKPAFIWGTKSKQRDWFILRKKFSVSNIANSALLTLTSAGSSIVFINGQVIYRGPARSYDFAKSYDTLDITDYLNIGENVILVSSMHSDEAGFIAELKVDNITSLYTDSTWRVKKHPCFDLTTAVSSAPLEPITWREERYNAEFEEDWHSITYDDTSWENATTVCKIGEPPFLKLNENIGGLLTDDIIYPKKFVASEWSSDRHGYSFRFEGESYQQTTEKASGINVLICEIISKTDTIADIFCSNIHQLLLNGRESQGKLRIKKGSNLLVCTRDYMGIELIISCYDELIFTTQNINTELKTEWCGCEITSNSMYPFNIPVESVYSTDETALKILSCSGIDELPDDIKNSLEEVYSLPQSTALEVSSQIFYKGSGCFCIPQIEAAKPRTEISDSFEPIKNRHNLLHSNTASALIQKNGEYNVHFILDFEAEVLGYLELSLKANKGTIVDISAFEKIDGTGISWMKMNCMRYICKDGRQTYISSYPRGFRYISVTIRNIKSPVEIFSIKLHQSVCAIEEVGSFFCDDLRLNSIFRMSLNTAKACMQDTYIDCPGFEQVYWFGDARTTATINRLHFGRYDFDQYCIDLGAESLSAEYIKEFKPNDSRYLDGKNLTVAAFSKYVDGGIPMWSFMWGLMCFENYLYSANRDNLSKNYVHLRSLLKNCDNNINSRELLEINGAWNLIEWANNDLSPYGEVTANNAWLVKCYNAASYMANELGFKDDATEFLSKAEILKNSINQYCWNEEKQGYSDTVRDRYAYEHYIEFCKREGFLPDSFEKYCSAERISEQTNTIMYICDCVPDTRVSAVKAIIKRAENKNFRAGAPSNRTYGIPTDKEAPDGIVAVGSPFFLYFTLEALYKMGEGDIALSLMRDVWGDMLDKDTKTCWETLPICDKEWTRSVCHAWSTAPAVYLITEVLGIKQIEPGYKKFSVKPNPSGLSHIKGSVATPFGPIYAEYKNGEITVSAPTECQCIK